MRSQSVATYITGDNGVGKTALAAGLARLGPEVLFLDARTILGLPAQERFTAIRVIVDGLLLDRYRDAQLFIDDIHLLLREKSISMPLLSYFKSYSLSFMATLPEAEYRKLVDPHYILTDVISLSTPTYEDCFNVVLAWNLYLARKYKFVHVSTRGCGLAAALGLHSKSAEGPLPRALRAMETAMSRAAESVKYTADMLELSARLDEILATRSRDLDPQGGNGPLSEVLTEMAPHAVHVDRGEIHDMFSPVERLPRVSLRIDLTRMREVASMIDLRATYSNDELFMLYRLTEKLGVPVDGNTYGAAQPWWPFVRAVIVELEMATAMANDEIAHAFATVSFHTDLTAYARELSLAIKARMDAFEQPPGSYEPPAMQRRLAQLALDQAQSYLLLRDENTFSVFACEFYQVT